MKNFHPTGNCPIRDVLSRLGDKWSMLVLITLNANGTMRFSDIHKTIEDVSQRMLTVTLRTLESDGLVERKVYADAHKLVYGAVDFAEAVGIDSEDSFDITKYILDEKKEEIPFTEFGRNGKHYLRADTDEEADLYIPIIMEAIGTDFTYSIEGVTDGEVDAAEVPYGDFDFSELNYDEAEFDRMFEKLDSREPQT